MRNLFALHRLVRLLLWTGGRMLKLDEALDVLNKQFG
jgi:hypothetical protein